VRAARRQRRLEVPVIHEQMTEVPTGALGYFRRPRIARQAVTLEHRLTNLRARVTGLSDEESQPS
jgi:hypothetical protein